ncbi:MAG: carboxypeptidase regulatory-like domain-containing protein [Candidatus Tectomicrobia bacterium]|uniref:Carboxypeptidase regulatory-like domain-containing protein n=1 Tax=Tectimicrobiota bacterium TaxID=2528274 RepID=A0A932CNH1_UNCTE|nr:carboxypeptidase regulatory-like domain-containing protein [Candidatus Tectomicrobia bacterium]
MTVKSKDISRQNFTCKRFQVSGMVKDRKNKPFPEVTVYLKQGGSTVGSSTTDAKGKYAFGFYNTGIYIVVPFKEGSRFDPPRIEATITQRSRGNVNFREIQQ